MYSSRYGRRRISCFAVDENGFFSTILENIQRGKKTLLSFISDTSSYAVQFGSFPTSRENRSLKAKKSFPTDFFIFRSENFFSPLNSDFRDLSENSRLDTDSKMSKDELIELILGHLRYPLTDVPPQPNSPPDYVFP